jgi:hypothetical protein
MHQPRSAIVPLIIDDAAGVLGHCDLLEQIGMILCFDAQDIVQIVRLQGLDVRGLGTQAVFGDDALVVRMILA